MTPHQPHNQAAPSTTLGAASLSTPQGGPVTCTAHHCDAPTPDGIHLCDTHEQALWELLAQIPDTLHDAQDTVARLDARHDTGRPSTTPSTPINLEASERVTTLTGLLTSWSRLLHEETGEAGDAGAHYLRTNFREIIRHDWAGDMLDELRAAHRRVIQAIDTAPDFRTYGPCHIDGCDGLVRGKADDVLARCRTCHEPYDATELKDNLLANAWDERAPLASVIRALNAAGVKIKYDRAKKWVERGKIAPGQDGTCTMAQVMEVLNAA